MLDFMGGPVLLKIDLMITSHLGKWFPEPILLLDRLPCIHGILLRGVWNLPLYEADRQ